MAKKKKTGKVAPPATRPFASKPPRKSGKAPAPPSTVKAPRPGKIVLTPAADGGVIWPRSKADPRLALLVDEADGGVIWSAVAGDGRSTNGPFVHATAVGDAPAGGGGVVGVPKSVSGLPSGRTALLACASIDDATALSARDDVTLLADTTDPAAAAAIVQRLGGDATRLLDSRTVSVRLPRKSVAAFVSDDAVRYAAPSVRVRPHLDLAHASANLPGAVGGTRARRTGRGVLVGVVDTGIDVAHPAFARLAADGRPAGTRIVDYLDQTTDTRYRTAAELAKAAAAAPDRVGHGTHVAGIAAGGGGGSPGLRYAGVAPEADLAAVRTTFDTVAIAEAVAHLFALADERKQPCVVNLSLGGHFGAHDGSDVLERAIDALCEKPGRVVVASAGNEGDARIHAHTVLPRGTPEPQRWVVDVELVRQVVDNQLMGSMWLQVWTQHEDDLRVTLRSPNGELYPIDPQARPNKVDRGKFVVDLSHDVAPYSQDHCFSIGLFTVAEDQWLSGWSVIVEEDRSAGRRGVEVGQVHAWVVSDGAGQFKSGTTREFLVGMPGTSFSVVTVASYATRDAWASRDPAFPGVKLDAVNLEDVSYFSSVGPNRDALNKPDISAPGQWIVSALSSAAGTDEVPDWMRLPGQVPYCAMQGTSMAAPYVTGAIALLLERHPRLSWAEVKRRLIKTARQDRYSSACWNARWGWGKIDVERLLTIEPE